MSSLDYKVADPRSETARAAVKASRVFSSLDDREIDDLLSASELLQVDTGEIICRPGDTGDHVGLVVSGGLAAEMPGRGANAPLNRIGPGEIYGEMAVLRGARRSAQVTAVEPTELLVVCQPVFLSLLVSHPAISIRILGTVSDRLHHLTEAFGQGLSPALP
jgi:CRP/FNR family cyclic AMP-dependent transcriptional regulator